MVICYLYFFLLATSLTIFHLFSIFWNIFFYWPPPRRFFDCFILIFNFWLATSLTICLSKHFKGCLNLWFCAMWICLAICQTNYVCFCFANLILVKYKPQYVSKSTTKLFGSPAALLMFGRCGRLGSPLGVRGPFLWAYFSVKVIISIKLKSESLPWCHVKLYFVMNLTQFEANIRTKLNRKYSNGNLWLWFNPIECGGLET